MVVFLTIICAFKRGQKSLLLFFQGGATLSHKFPSQGKEKERRRKKADLSLVASSSFSVLLLPLSLLYSGGKEKGAGARRLLKRGASLVARPIEERTEERKGKLLRRHKEILSEKKRFLLLCEKFRGMNSRELLDLFQKKNVESRPKNI